MEARSVNHGRGDDARADSGEDHDRRGGRGPDQFERWMMTIMAALVAAGVAGVWQLSTSVARLEERVANLVVVSNDTFRQIALDLRGMDTRINMIERRLAIPIPDPPPPRGPFDNRAVPPVAIPPGREYGDDRRRQ